METLALRRPHLGSARRYVKAARRSPTKIGFVLEFAIKAVSDADNLFV
jgi:hypothetical protein